MQIPFVVSSPVADWANAPPALMATEPSSTASRTHRPAESREFIVSVVLPLSEAFITESLTATQANVSLGEASPIRRRCSHRGEYDGPTHFLHSTVQNLVKDFQRARVSAPEAKQCLRKERYD